MIGLAIKAALERAESHERLSPRKLRVRIGFQYFAEHHAEGLVISARFAARSAEELAAQDGCMTIVPYAEIDARAHEFVSIVDAMVRRAEAALGVEPVA
mgnify:CR=1 FL=1